MTQPPRLTPQHPLVQSVTALALQAEEQGYRYLAIVLISVVKCCGIHPAIAQRLANTAVMIADTICLALETK